MAATPRSTLPGSPPLPRTGYLAAAMAKAAAQDVAAAIAGSRRVAPGLQRLLGLRLLAGGDAGVLLLRADLRRSLWLVLPVQAD